jgi:hypothetical protein
LEIVKTDAQVIALGDRVLFRHTVVTLSRGNHRP